MVNLSIVSIFKEEFQKEKEESNWSKSSVDYRFTVFQENLKVQFVETMKYLKSQVTVFDLVFFVSIVAFLVGYYMGYDCGFSSHSSTNLDIHSLKGG
ncbi:hypothetical protein MSSAC_2386 [Methanosarcina siciliae C2J]|uniref:Uncharacterized protein n=1 Tax=Methanosarcina siciliae C2J TaxID=1434118 RepID=A0A0E3LDB4_9EURY|nr:hypothetical protein [Methanosarcina siciliae]AKB36976.1 hypothetical protein MSSAC_2386 [Methanosarcina siciliae C2J]